MLVWKMKLVRFMFLGVERFGVLADGRVEEMSGDVFDPGDRTGEVYDPGEIIFLPPAVPSKIICVGFNYRAHADELGDIATKKPTITLKAQNSVIGHGHEILLPGNSVQVEHEAELGVVIGMPGYCIEHPEDHILGYTVVNDITARDVERELVQWSASKSFPTFCPVGPCVETELDPSDLRLRCWVNGGLRQDSRTSLMIYSALECVRFVSRFMRLERGDLIATGTVPGVGSLYDGDLVEVEVEGVGRLSNPVKRG